MTQHDEFGSALREALPVFDAPPSLKAWALEQARDADRSSSAPHGSLRDFAQRMQGTRWMRPAQVAAMLMIGVAVGWGGAQLNMSNLRESAGQRTAAAVVDTHVRSLLPGHLTDVLSTDRHTVKPWFAGKADIAPPVNDLSAKGFPLYGGRLDYVEGHSAAAIVYHRRQHVINLFVWRASPGESVAGAFSVRGYSVLHWTSGDLSFWAVSDAARGEV
jgi:anti-sigma factor RsiW